MKDRMFVIPGSFVPYNDTVTLLTYKRLRNLDLDMDIFCFKGKEDKSILKELENDKNFSKFNIEYTSNLETAIARNNPIRLPASLLLMNKYVHDSLKKFEKRDYKYLYTSIVPGISHVCGYKIKKKHPDVIWYASFSDPFKGSPYKKADLSKRSIFYRIAFTVGSFCYYWSRYEELAIMNADKLVFICEEQRNFTLNQYKNKNELMKKSVIMPLTYIPEWEMYKDLLIENEKTNNKQKQAVHLGRLYGLRKINTFIEALNELKNEDSKLSKKIVFHQYSEIQPYDIQKIKEYGLEDLFVIHNKVTYKESVNIMKKADVLVLFDTLLPDEKIQPYLPSKIVEYLMLKKPILGICDNNSPSYRILNEYGFNTIGSNKEQIKTSIKSILNDKIECSYSLEKLNNDNYSLLNDD